MAKYTDAQLAKMAEETLRGYNLGDNRADIMIALLCNVTGRPQSVIIAELNKMCDKVG